jgi:hypothetical protein
MPRPPDGLATIEGSKFESYHVQKSKSLQHHQVTAKIPKYLPEMGMQVDVPGKSWNSGNPDFAD